MFFQYILGFSQNQCRMLRKFPVFANIPVDITHFVYLRSQAKLLPASPKMVGNTREEEEQQIRLIYS
jgi:hypothetical protein